MENTQTVEPKKSERIESIDKFRGILIFFVILSFFLGVFEDAFQKIAPLFEHGDSGFQILPGIAFADIFAPMFIFVIGMTFVKSFKSREAKYGTRVAFWQMALRYFGLMGVGALLNGFEDGWLDVFNGTKFSELDKNSQVFAIGFWIAIALILVVLISRITKNEKFKNVAAQLLRYFVALMGVFVLYFMIVSTAEKITVPETTRYGGWIWDTLQNIGLAGLIALPFIKFDKWGKLIMVGILFTVMSVFNQNGGFALSKSILEGGLLGGASWAGILMLGSVFIELRGTNKYWILSSLLLLVSVVLIVAFDFVAAKRGCTPVYAMFTASLGALAFAGIDAISKYTTKFPFFKWWGGSSLLVYVINYLVCLILGAIFEVANYTAPLWLAILLIVVFVALYSVMNWQLSKKDKHIRL